MSIQEGTYTLGPENGTLSVRTGRTGAVAKAGHDLLIQVTGWRATLDVADGRTSIELDADPTSLRVREGTGGMQKLDAGDMDNIRQTIDDEVLERRAIAFRSTDVRPSADGSGLTVDGELTLGDASRPLSFDLALDGGRVTGTAVVRQTDWGIKPYTALFGALKVADEVKVVIDATLPE
jgi:polyisoprenoid-binding protein YceI